MTYVRHFGLGGFILKRRQECREDVKLKNSCYNHEGQVSEGTMLYPISRESNEAKLLQDLIVLIALSTMT